jgi:hypothetical protein
MKDEPGILDRTVAIGSAVACWGRRVRGVAAAAVALSVLGAVNGLMLVTPRLLFAMGEDGWPRAGWVRSSGLPHSGCGHPGPGGVGVAPGRCDGAPEVSGFESRRPAALLRRAVRAGVSGPSRSRPWAWRRCSSSAAGIQTLSGPTVVSVIRWCRPCTSASWPWWPSACWSPRRRSPWRASD